MMEYDIHTLLDFMTLLATGGCWVLMGGCRVLGAGCRQRFGQAWQQC